MDLRGITLNGRVISGFGLTTLSRNHPHTVVVETRSLEKIASEMSAMQQRFAIFLSHPTGARARHGLLAECEVLDERDTDTKEQI